jgi:hypothetical protein
MKHKHYDLIIAWANGAKIQGRYNGGGWVDFTSPFWDGNDAEFRIKPESTCPRCGKVHTCEPVDPDKILKEQAKEIADAIDAAVLNQINQRIYYEREAEYCREEMEAFIQSPSDETRLRVLLKRRQFLESGGSDTKPAWPGNTASVNWVAASGWWSR